jgi:TM2 domain-containing membrane protein YozV
MDCVNHNGVQATAYCQSCGKALCAGCVRNAPGGQILCEPCWTAWHAYQQPFAAPQPGTPSPATAAVLGLIPGVGAMYNGQFIKGLIHVVIFAVLVSAAHLYGIFGLFIAAWIVYQSFEAYHTARARRDGDPLPDPLGLNEAGGWLNPGGRAGYTGTPPGPASAGPAGPGPAGQEPAGGSYQPPYQSTSYGQTGYQQAPYQTPYTPPAGGYTDPAGMPIPPIPPPPPGCCWQRKEPVGAIVLIALGLLFLLGQMDIFSGRLVEYAWPLLLICLGAWMIIRRLGESRGGTK